MTHFYSTEAGTLSHSENATPGCWVAMTHPNQKEIERISTHYGIDADAISAALDLDERSRIETDENYTMILVNIPTIEKENDKELYNTIPLGIIMAKDAVITICSEDSPILRSFSKGRVKDLKVNLKSRFVLQLLFMIATYYLKYLRYIDRKSDEVENKLHKSMQNHELIELLKLEKSLVYFTTALRSNEAVMEKLFRNDVIKQYPEDSELLADVIVENKQAIEMANIYSGILSGMMDAFASVISNNLNIVMKVLAVVTIVMAIPTMIFSAYGMNVNISGMPFAQSPYGFLIIIGMSVLVSTVATLIFAKLKMFK